MKETFNLESIHVRNLCKTHSFLTLSPWQSCRAAPLLDVRSVLSSAYHHHHVNIIIIITIIIIIITCICGGGGELGGQPQLERHVTSLGDGATARRRVLGGQFVHVSPDESS